MTLNPFLRMLISRDAIETTPDIPRFSEFDRGEAGFNDFYVKHVKPLRDDMERTRVTKLRKMRKSFYRLVPMTTLWLLVGLTTLWLGWDGVEPFATVVSWFDWANSIVLLIVVVAPLPLAWLWVTASSTIYSKDTKQEILPVLVKFFGEDWRYRKNGGFDNTLLISGAIGGEFDGFEDENAIFGSYQGVPVQIADVSLYTVKKKTRFSSTESNISKEYIYKGFALGFRVRRKFNGKTIGVNDRGMLNWTRKKAGILNKVSMDDREFESKFEVFTSDPEEARHLLSKNLMKQLVGLIRAFQSSHEDCSLQFSFYNNQMLILISEEATLFRPTSIYEPALRAEELKQFLLRADSIFKVIEETDVDRFARW